MKPLLRALQIVGVLLAVLSLAFGYCGFGLPFAFTDPVKVKQALIVCFWILTPPLWFGFETWARSSDVEDDRQFDRLKYNQELASKIWLALVSVLLLLYFGKDIAAKV